MITVILSAGKSTRFTHEGFPSQKSMLPMPDSRTLLEWQIQSLAPQRLIYITREDYKNNEMPMLKKLKFGHIGGSQLKVVFLHRDTKGPLDSLWAARKYLKTHEELLIAYNDEWISGEIVDKFVHAARDRSLDASVVCFRNDNDRFSRIPRSDLACGCTYYFRSGMDFIRLMANNERGAKNGVPDTIYAAENWSAFELREGEYAELGTSREYKWFMAEQGTPVRDW